jgi:hypothetical protein
MRGSRRRKQRPASFGRAKRWSLHYRFRDRPRMIAASRLLEFLNSWLLSLFFSRIQASFVLQREGTIDRLSYSGGLPNHEGFI